MPKLLRLVAWLEVTVGALMLVDIAPAALALDATRLLAKAPLIALGALGLWAGIGLGRARGHAWHASAALQLAQLPVILLAGIHYRPGLGLLVPLGAHLPRAGDASLLSEFSFGVDFAMALQHASPSASPYAALNLAALACLIVLLRHRPAARGFVKRCSAT